MSDDLEVVATPWYSAELMELSRDDRRRVRGRLEALERKGWRQAVNDQTVRHLSDGIHELRVLGHGAAFRVLFFVAPGRTPRLVVLTTCAAKSIMKKRQRMEAEIARASARRDWWLEQQTKKEGDDGR